MSRFRVAGSRAGGEAAVVCLASNAFALLDSVVGLSKKGFESRDVNIICR